MLCAVPMIKGKQQVTWTHLFLLTFPACSSCKGREEIGWGIRGPWGWGHWWGDWPVEAEFHHLPNKCGLYSAYMTIQILGKISFCEILLYLYLAPSGYTLAAQSSTLGPSSNPKITLCSLLPKLTSRDPETIGGWRCGYSWVEGRTSSASGPPVPTNTCQQNQHTRLSTQQILQGT